MGSEPLGIDERVYENVGHRFSDGMLDDAIRWIENVVGRSERGMQPVWLAGERDIAGEAAAPSHL